MSCPIELVLVIQEKSDFSREHERDLQYGSTEQFDPGRT